MKSRGEEYKELCEQMNQLSEAVLGFREGGFVDIMKGVNSMSSDNERLRKELDQATRTIR
jgi:hypothetical protein